MKKQKSIKGRNYSFSIHNTSGYQCSLNSGWWPPGVSIDDNLFNPRSDVCNSLSYRGFLSTLQM